MKGSMFVAPKVLNKGDDGVPTNADADLANLGPKSGPPCPA